eukprot:ANDGO_03515.mRNA.1 Cytosolic Fe-S cluster assembly factor NBP35
MSGEDQSQRSQRSQRSESSQSQDQRDNQSAPDMSTVPEHCPGPSSETAGQTSACAGCPNQSLCASGAVRQPKDDPDIPIIRHRMSSVKHRVLVMSGKGGVGKSTLSTQLSLWLALLPASQLGAILAGQSASTPVSSAVGGNWWESYEALADSEKVQVGLCDLDICGPSIPTMLRLPPNPSVHASNAGVTPIYPTIPVSLDDAHDATDVYLDNLAVMSIGALLPSESTAVIWRGDRKSAMVRTFLRDVDWGDLDFLFIDTPPGTSDEHITVSTTLRDVGALDGALLVTTPQAVACADVRRQISFCKKVGIPILGIVENMSGYVCKKCKTETAIFRASEGGGEALAIEFGIPFLGRIPLDGNVVRAGDAGVPLPDGIVARALHSVGCNLLHQIAAHQVASA